MDIQTKDGILLRGIPDGTPDDVIKARIAKIRGESATPKLIDNPVANYAGSLVEPALNMATSMVAKPVSEVAGLAALAKNLVTGSRDDVEGFSRNVQDRMTYSPRTKGGDAVVKSPLNPVNILGNTVNAASDVQRSIVGGDAHDDSPRGMIANALREAGIQALGMVGMKGAPAISAGIGTAANTVTAPLRAAGNVVRSVIGPESGRAGRLLNDVAGAKRDAVIAAMENSVTRVPGERLTAGMAAVDAASPEFAALQEIIANRSPGKYKSGGIEAANEAARLAEIGRHAGNADALARLKTVRDAETGPQREIALTNADMANQKGPPLATRLGDLRESIVNALQDKGRFQTTAAQQENLSHGGRIELSPNQTANQPQFNVGATGGRIPKDIASENIVAESYLKERKARTVNAARVPEAQAAAVDAAGIEAARKAQAGLTKYQLDSLAAHGHYPLKTQTIVEGLNAKISSPVTSTVARKTLTSIRDDILARAKGAQEISSRALYTVRKELGDTIKVHSKETQNWDKRHAAGLEISVQKAIDDAIAAAGGTGWRDYLSKYRELSGPIENMKSAQALESSLTTPLGATERPAAFAKAAASKKNPVTSQQVQSSVDAIIDSLSRDATYNRLAQEGVSATTRIIGADTPKVPPTGMFNPTISTARALFNKFSDKATAKTLTFLENNMDNPAKIAQLMRDASPKQKMIIEAVMRQNAIKAAGVVAPYAAEQGEQR